MDSVSPGLTLNKENYCTGEEIVITLTGTSSDNDYLVLFENQKHLNPFKTKKKGNSILYFYQSGKLPAGTYIIGLYKLQDNEKTLVQSKKITINLSPEPEIKGNDYLCPDSEEVLYSVDMVNNHTYQWLVKEGDILGDANKAIIFVNWMDAPIGSVKVFERDEKTGCTGQDELIVSVEDIERPVIPACPKDKTIPVQEGQFAQYVVKGKELDILPHDNCGIYLVNNNFNQLPTLENAVITNPTTITWTVIDNSGNMVTCDFEIAFKTENELIPPNAFSPNGDGINDTWTIQGASYFPNMTVKILDNRGRLIFESEQGYPYSWDGTLDGMELPVDTYFYIISLNNGNDKPPMRGTVTIIK